MNAARGLAYYLNDESAPAEKNDGNDGNGSGSGTKDEQAGTVAAAGAGAGSGGNSRSRSRSPRSAERSSRRSSSPSRHERKYRSRRDSRDRDSEFDRLDDGITKSNNPNLILSRVFIGNLPSDKTTKEELFDQYKRFGKVLGISVHKGFGFVQFDEEHAAIKAVENLDKTIFKGNLLDLRISSKGRKQPIPNNPIITNAPMPHMKRPYDDERMPPPHYDQYRMHDRGPPPPNFRDMPPMVRGDDPYLTSVRYPPGVGAANQFAPRRGGMPLPPPNPELFRDDHRDASFSVMSSPAQLSTPLSSSAAPSTEPYGGGLSKKVDYGVERPFDAVIIVTQQSLKLYAEMVERRLLELNMVVDMIFLLNDKALNKAIDDMTCRGVLYIIVVQPQNEEHKSITVNIMHGTPQEHRNMPLEDALVLLARNFNAYLSSLRCGSEQPTMGFLLNLLADGKHLSVAELDRIIAHLQDRRDRLIEAEGGRKEPAAAGLNAAGTTALQQKILSILSGTLFTNSQSGTSIGPPVTSSTNQNQGAGGQGGGLGPAPAAVLTNLAQQFGICMNQPTSTNQQQASKSDQPMETGGGIKPAGIGGLTFSDPNLKRTIDSLLQNPNILKSLQVGGGGGNLPPKSTPSNVGGPQPSTGSPLLGGGPGGPLMPPPTSMAAAPFAGGPPMMPHPPAGFQPGGGHQQQQQHPPGKFRF